MQYILRLIFSVLVMISHFWHELFLSPPGGLAVIGFYVISGFVITLVLVETYGFTGGGFRLFWINRFLRLYPAFFAASVLGFLAIAYDGEAARSVHRIMVLPWSEAASEILAAQHLSPDLWPVFALQQITLVGYQSPFVWTSPIGFAPNAWSVNMEIYFYLAFSMGLVATSTNVRIFFSTATLMIVIFFAIQLIFGYEIYFWDFMKPYANIYYYDLFYKSPIGIAFFFALGAIIYYMPKSKIVYKLRMLPLILLAIVVILPADTPDSIILRLIAFGLITGLVIYAWPNDRPGKHVKMIGDISYPLFVIHWPVAAWTKSLTGLSPNSPAFLFVAGTASIVVAYLVLMLVERPIERLRDRVRDRVRA